MVADREIKINSNNKKTSPMEEDVVTLEAREPKRILFMAKKPVSR